MVDTRSNSLLGAVYTAITSPRAQPAPTATSTSTAPVLSVDTSAVDTSAVVETDLVAVNADLHRVLAQAQTENSQVLAENCQLLVENAELRRVVSDLHRELAHHRAPSPTPTAPPAIGPTGTETASSYPARPLYSDKMNWPTCEDKAPGEATYQARIRWRSKTLAIVQACELAPLYDPTSQDLVLSSNSTALKRSLFAHLLQGLPSEHPMTSSAQFNGDGLKLWHAFCATFRAPVTFQSLIALTDGFYIKTSRSDNEDVYSYFSRLEQLALRINQASPGRIPDFDFRMKFLLSLGPEFQFLNDSEAENRLEPSFLSMPDHELLVKLQGILTNKKDLRTMPAHHVPTSASLGYSAHATVSTRAPAPVASASMEAQMATLMTAMEAAYAAREADAEARRIASLKYCWTCGYNTSHSGADCRRGAADPNHKKEATAANKMGGSTRVWKPRT
jgi:hypothetical protein